MGRPKGSKNKPKVTESAPSNTVKNKVVNTTSSTSTTVVPKVKASISTPQGEKTVSEVKDVLQKYDTLKEVFAATNDALKLIDLTKTESRSYSTYNRETLKTYLKSPFAYQTQLKNLSRYLYRLCYEYKRICTFFAKMICGDTFDIIPLLNSAKLPKPDDFLNTFYETAVRWERMDFKNELTKLLITAWREDTVYAYVYDDSDQEGGTCFFHILDGDYCKISSIEEGVFRFAFDFSYFKSHKTDLDYLDSEFKTKYDAYEKDVTLRWQELEPDRQICFKVNSDDPKMDYPPFASLFPSIISNIELVDLQDVKDELSAYKLLVARLKPLSGTDQPDDFEVDINTAIKYYNKLAESLPDCVSACISPLPIEAIEFKDLNTTETTDMISTSMSNLFKRIGGITLDNSKTGTTVFEAQIIADMEVGQATLLPQVERWINLYFNYVIGTDHAKIQYIQGVSPYTRKAKRKELLESAQNGLPKLKIGILDGNSPLETLSQLYLEECLSLVDRLVPLSTSYTKSNSDTDPINGGRPEIDDSTSLTDEGSASREK